MFVAFSAWLLRVLCVYTLIPATSVPARPTSAKLSTFCHSVHPKCQIVSHAHYTRARIFYNVYLSRIARKKERDPIFMSRTPLPSHILSISHAKLTLFIPVGDAVFFPYRANGLPATASFWLGGAMGLSAVSEAGGRYARLRRARGAEGGERRERITASASPMSRNAPSNKGYMLHVPEGH